MFIYCQEKLEANRLKSPASVMVSTLSEHKSGEITQGDHQISVALPGILPLLSISHQS